MGVSVAQEIEPENGKLGQDLALVRNAGGQDVVERRDAVGGDNQQLSVHAIDVAHFALRVPFDSRQFGMEDDGF